MRPRPSSSPTGNLCLWAVGRRAAHGRRGLWRVGWPGAACPGGTGKGLRSSDPLVPATVAWAGNLADCSWAVSCPWPPLARQPQPCPPGARDRSRATRGGKMLAPALELDLKGARPGPAPCWSFPAIPGAVRRGSSGVGSVTPLGSLLVWEPSAALRSIETADDQAASGRGSHHSPSCVHRLSAPAPPHPHLPVPLSSHRNPGGSLWP